MERKKALLTSALIAGSLTVGAFGVAAGSGLVGAPTDNVGKLQPISTQPTQVTVYFDPATGLISATPPAATAPDVAKDSTPAPGGEQKHKDGEHKDGEHDD